MGLLFIEQTLSKEDLMAADLDEVLAHSTLRLLEHPAARRKSGRDFDAMWSYIYFVEEGGKRRLASKKELENPSEALFAEPVGHASVETARKFALVLWAAGGVNRFARAADIKLVYENAYVADGKKPKTTNNAAEVMREKIAEISAALAWWVSPARLTDVANAMNAADKRARSVIYPSNGNFVEPYRAWLVAANAIEGMRVASGASQRALRKLKYKSKLRPDEKAQFIRDYIATQARGFEAGVEGEFNRDMEEVCTKIEDFMDKHAFFESEKTRDIIRQVKRAAFLRVSERQALYLKRVLADCEAYDALEGRDVSDNVFDDVDEFFEELLT
jgi:hypothetical protein